MLLGFSQLDIIWGIAILNAMDINARYPQTLAASNAAASLPMRLPNSKEEIPALPPSGALTPTKPIKGDENLQKILSKAVATPEKQIAPFEPQEAQPRQLGDKPLWKALIPVGYRSESMFFSENSVPFNSMVLTVDLKAYERDVTKPSYIALAAMKVNPNIQFIVPTSAHFVSLQDPAFLREQSLIAQRLGVPIKNVIPIRADTPYYPQDEYMLARGPQGVTLVKPKSDLAVDGVRRTAEGANQTAYELGLKVATAKFITRGGDNFVIKGPNGEPLAYFGEETVASTAMANGLSHKLFSERLLAIAIIMKGLVDTGIGVQNIMPIGGANNKLAEAKTPGEILTTLSLIPELKDPRDHSPNLRKYVTSLLKLFGVSGLPSQAASGGVNGYDWLLSKLTPAQKLQLGNDFIPELYALRDRARADAKFNTYGQVLAQLSPTQRDSIDPAVFKRLQEMRELPFPRWGYAYHTDVMSFTPDGKNMFIRSSDAQNGRLQELLQFFGFKPIVLPSGKLVNPVYDYTVKDKSQFTLGNSFLSNTTFDKNQMGGATLNYMNMVQGMYQGRHVILMPTEAVDPEKLTQRDEGVRQQLLEAVPNAIVVPIGGASALIHQGAILASGKTVDKQHGAHCMSNVLPLIIRAAQESRTE
jgi:hypothetical protein